MKNSYKKMFTKKKTFGNYEQYFYKNFREIFIF